MITINRKSLLDDLFDFAQGGSGLIVGKPGVGKSYILKELKSYCLEKKILSFLIKIDNLYDASDEAIQRELGFTDNWIETFKKIKIPDGKKALLIFDAFDAARNEQFRGMILGQIKTAKDELANKWNVLVSVRTYDASKSQQLIQLFPLAENVPDNVYCRKRIIPVLENEEVINAISTNHVLFQFYTESSKSLQEVLRIPFFLILCERILEGASDHEVGEIKKLKSETQLLQVYWNRKIVNSPDHLVKEKILLNLLNQLIQLKSLSCPKQLFLKEFNSADSQSFEYLRSENIIDEVSVAGSRIALAHNILFDYAVSALYINIDINSVLQFINEDSSRPFFLRPSFIYFFTQLWYDDRPFFWKFFESFSSEKRKEIQLFVRLVLTGVVSSDYSALNDLLPIIENSDIGPRNAGIRNFLQSIRFIRKKTLPQDIEAIAYLSKRLDEAFVWDFAFLLDRAINETGRIDQLMDRCGQAARNLLEYVLNNRATALHAVVDRLGATRGVELVCKTYDTDIIASKALIQRLFGLLKEPIFEIYYFSSLSEYVKNILPFDAAFVGEIYLTLFGHKETSDARTSMGGSVIMNFTSNRRQDFDMVYFRLTEFFPTFLSEEPLIAIPTGLQIVNHFVIYDRQGAYESLGQYSFSIKGHECRFIADMSAIWGDNISYHKPADIANRIISYFKGLLEKDKLTELVTFLDLYIQSASVGYAWKQLLEFGQLAVAKLPDYFFDFCIQSVFFSSSDTSFEIGKLVEEGCRYFTEPQIMQIEELIFAIAEASRKDGNTSFLRKFLSRIPFQRLQLETSKKIIEEAGVAENTKPYQFSSSSSAYTNEMWLEDQGVDTADPQNAALLQMSNELSVFNETWRNGFPQKQDYIIFFEKGRALFNRLSGAISELNNDIIYTVLNEVSLTFTIISRDISNLDENEFMFLKQVVFFCFNYVSQYDKNLDKDLSPSSGYSPTPRITASEALTQVVAKEDTAHNIEVLRAAASDTNPIIRLHAIRNIKTIFKKQPAVYWELIYLRIDEEDDALTTSIILGNIILSPYDEAKANRLLLLSNKKEHLFKWNNPFLDTYSILLFRLYVLYKNELANNILSEAYLRPEFCRTIIFKAFEDFRISSLQPGGNQELYIDSCLKWVLIYLERTSETLKALAPEEFRGDNPVVKTALDLFDLIIQRIFFVLEQAARFGKHSFVIPEANRRYLYFKIKPVFEKILLISSEIPGGGLITGHTAHYFIQTLSSALLFEARKILSMVTTITKLSFQTGYTFDSVAIREVVSLTEKLFADHRELLSEPEPFDNLIDLLDMYMASGWVDALELLWKLDEIFK